MSEQNYNIRVFGKNIEITNAIKDYVTEKMHKIERLTSSLMEVNITLEVQRLDHSVNISVKFSHFRVNVHAKTLEMYSAIDRAFEKLDSKMRRWKGRIQDHHAKGVSAIDMKINVLNAPEDLTEDVNASIAEENQKALEDVYFPPKVARTKTRPLKMLTLEEAVMKMHLSSDHFMIYKSQEQQDMRVIYRRRDGSLGVMIPE